MYRSCCLVSSQCVMILYISYHTGLLDNILIFREKMSFFGLVKECLNLVEVLTVGIDNL